MKKFLGFFVLCLLVNGAWGMREKRLEPDGGSEKELTVSAVALKRRELSPIQQKELNSELLYLLKSKKSVEKYHHKLVQQLLECGADPNAGDDCPFVFAIQKGKTFVDLLLKYGANPRLDDRYYAPITFAPDFATIQSLVRAGADINGVNRLNESILADVCGSVGFDLYAAVWLLSHDVDPNVGPTPDSLQGKFAIHAALFDHDLAKVIALLQHGARLNVKTKLLETPFQDAYRMWQYAGSIKEKEICLAQYMLLRTIDAGMNNPAYKIDLFDSDPKTIELAMVDRDNCPRLSHESAVLIGKAIDDVATAKAKADFDDLTYDHGNVTKFALDCGLGSKRMHTRP